MTDIKDIIKKAFPLEELPTDEENNQFAEEAMLKTVLDKGKIWLCGEEFSINKGIATKINPLSAIKPLSITELTDKYRKIDSAPSIIFQTKDWCLNAGNEIEQEFRRVLDKRGISEAEWKEFGEVVFLPRARMYKYKGEGIFITNVPEITNTVGDLQVDCKIVYGELK